MRLLKSIKPVFIIAAAFLTTILLSGVINLDKITGILGSNNDISQITLRNFTPGAQVSYRVLSGNNLVAEEQKLADEHGVLSLPVGEDVLANNNSEEKTVKYELSVSKPEILKENGFVAKDLGQDPAELLNLLLSLNPEDGKMDLSVKGLDEYANVILKQNGGIGQALSADWTGMFATTLGGAENGEQLSGDHNQIQLVFQNAGIQSDLLQNMSGMPLVEVQITGSALGTGTRDKQRAHWGGPFANMTEQFVAVMALQTTAIGMFIDASIQLENQRKLQELQARAYKDYHPSEQMCRVGSYIRSVALSESKTELEKVALNKYLLNQYGAIVHSSSAGGPEVYEGVKIRNYMEDYCHSVDNGSAVEAICDAVTNATTADDLERMDKDIDYTRSIETRLTLDIDFEDATSDPDEEDVLAMARYLYFPTAFNSVGDVETMSDVRPHFNSRSYAAKMSVAHNSFINIVGMKSSAPEGQPTNTVTTTSPTVAPFGTGSPVEETGLPQTPYLTTRDAPTIMTEDSGWAYMKSMMREFTSTLGTALSDNEIERILGERPSYYAQMEVLTKKIYQNPNFYINLYDKPANVKRIGAALDAILLMHQRDRFESLLRQEMLSAVLVENTLYDEVNEINSGMLEEMQRSQIED